MLHKHQIKHKHRSIVIWIIVMLTLWSVFEIARQYRKDPDLERVMAVLGWIAAPALTCRCKQKQNVGSMQTTAHKIVHFVSSVPDEQFAFYQYLAIRAARRFLDPDELIFWVPAGAGPYGKWWERAKNELRISVREKELPHDIFNRSVALPAHISDVVRLQTLIDYGGLYLDLDMVMVRPLPEKMWHTPQLDELKYQSTTTSDDIACASLTIVNEHDLLDYQKFSNALLLTTRTKDPFLERWLAEYRTFDDNDYAYHGVKLPAKLAKTEELRNLINVLPASFAFRPRPLNLYHANDYDFIRNGNYAIHLWHSMATAELEAASPAIPPSTTFGRLIQHVMA